MDGHQSPAAPPLPPSPIEGDLAVAPEDARLPWHTVPASLAGGVVGGALVGLLMHLADPTDDGVVVLAAMAVFGVVASVYGTALTAADRAVRPRWRMLSWTLAAALPACAAAVLARSVRGIGWVAATVVGLSALLGLALALAARTRRLLPWLSLLGAAVVGALAPLTVIAVADASFGPGGLALGVGDVLVILDGGALTVGPLGLAVGLCLYFERRRVEDEGG